MNEEAHWNTIAPSYNQEIFDVYKSDKRKVLPRYLKKHANSNHAAMDFGCGNGKSFFMLAALFRNVVAIDISQGLIDQAQTRPYTNITYKQLDLSRPKIKLPRVDFVFCCNVIMLPEIEKNYRMLRNIYHALNAGGSALIVLPSMESALFSSWRMIDLYRREGVSARKIPAGDLEYFKPDKIDIMQGIVGIGGVPTKHYSSAEIEVIFKDRGLSVTAIEKIEYDWDTEFSSPPKWMKGPYPWDWMVECTRVK